MTDHDGWNRDASGEPAWFRDYPAIRSKAGLLWFLFCLAAVLIFSSCAPLDANRRIAVKVVAIRCEPRSGASDCRTVVQGPADLRYMRPGKWGELGDEFNIYATAHNLWVLTP